MLETSHAHTFPTGAIAFPGKIHTVSDYWYSFSSKSCVETEAVWMAPLISYLPGFLDTGTHFPHQPAPTPSLCECSHLPLPWHASLRECGVAPAPCPSASPGITLPHSVLNNDSLVLGLFLLVCSASKHICALERQHDSAGYLKAALLPPAWRRFHLDFKNLPSKKSDLTC